ncbi:MAG: hypothetical protein ABIK27_06940 [Bacteroidota bacterium]
MIDIFQNWFGYIFDRYQVSPLVFGIIYLASVAPCWYSLFKIVRSFKQKDQKRVIFWSSLFSLLFISPYAYVYIAGRNYPWWFHIIFGIVVVVSILYMIQKIKQMIVKRGI